MLKLSITKDFKKKLNKKYDFFLISKFLSIKCDSYFIKKRI